MEMISNIKIEIVIVGKVRGITQSIKEKQKLSLFWQEPIISLGEKKSSLKSKTFELISGKVMV